MKKNIFELETPCYVIDKVMFHRNAESIFNAFRERWGENILWGYSIKTNHMDWFLQEARAMGAKAEAVSGDELNLALEVGYECSETILNGPQKTKKDIEKVLQNGGIVNADNFSDIDMICKIYHENSLIKGKVGLRVNFNLEKECHGETTAGREVSRFGICLENGDIKKAIKMLKDFNIPIAGLHMHYSTKSRSANVFSALAKCSVKIIKEYALNDIEYIDIGGGFFGGQINDKYPTMQEYAEVICGELEKYLDPSKVTLILEPGASILATSVEYISEVINERYIQDAKVLTMDGSILHINPFMTSRTPNIKWILKEEERKSISQQIVSGCTCMENDRFIKIYDEQEIKSKDRMSIIGAGAYTMAFNSCFINVPPKIYLKSEEGWQLLRVPHSNINNLI